jgi:hypothetical protein
MTISGRNGREYILGRERFCVSYILWWRFCCGLYEVFADLWRSQWDIFIWRSQIGGNSAITGISKSASPVGSVAKRGRIVDLIGLTIVYSGLERVLDGQIWMSRLAMM